MLIYYLYIIHANYRNTLRFIPLLCILIIEPKICLLIYIKKFYKISYLFFTLCLHIKVSRGNNYLSHIFFAANHGFRSRKIDHRDIIKKKLHAENASNDEVYKYNRILPYFSYRLVILNLFFFFFLLFFFFITKMKPNFSLGYYLQCNSFFHAKKVNFEFKRKKIISYTSETDKLSAS